MPKTTTYKTVAGLNKALRRLPKEASAQMRTASLGIAQMVADEAAGRARSQGKVAALVAPTIKAKRDRVPVVKMGDSSPLPMSGNGWERRTRNGERQTVGDIIWGAEFGGGVSARTQQFLPHRGRQGYFLWPTVRDRSDDIDTRYSDALLDALEALP